MALTLAMSSLINSDGAAIKTWRLPGGPQFSLSVLSLSPLSECQHTGSTGPGESSVSVQDYHVVCQQEAVQRGRLLLPTWPGQISLPVGRGRDRSRAGLQSQAPLLLLLGPGQAQHLLLGVVNILLAGSLPCTSHSEHYSRHRKMCHVNDLYLQDLATGEYRYLHRM